MRWSLDQEYLYGRRYVIRDLRHVKSSKAQKFDFQASTNKGVFQSIYVTVSLYSWCVWLWCIYVLLRACTFHVNRLGLCIFTGYYLLCIFTKNSYLP